jgi:flagellar FliL protein
MLSKITGNKMILGAVVGIGGGLIVAVLLVAVLGVGKSPTPAVAEAGVAPAKAATAVAAKPPAQGAGQAPAGEGGARSGLVYVIKDRIVNLADPGGRRYLRYTVALEFADKSADKKAAGSGNQLAIYLSDEDQPAYQTVAGDPKNDPQKEFLARIQKFTPALEDAVVTVLSSKTSNDLASADGKEQAKREIKDRCQRILGSEETITNVYFPEFVMQ